MKSELSMNSPSSRAGGALGRAPSTGLDVIAIIGIFRRRWKLIAAVTAAMLTIALIAAYTAQPLYDAGALLKIDTTERPVAPTDEKFVQNPDQALVDSEVDILTSRDIAARVAKRLNLIADPEFNPPFDGPQQPSREQQESMVLDYVQGGLSAAKQPQTYLVNVVFRSSDPEKSAKIANAFAEEYLLSSAERRAGTASRQARWLDERLKTMGAEVEQNDARVARYRAEKGITKRDMSGTVTDQQIAPISSQLAEAEAQAASARAQLQAARTQIATGGIDTVSAVLTSQVIADLRRQRAEVIRNLADLSGKYGPQHPSVLRVNQQMSEIDRQLAQEARRIVAGLQANANAAEASAAAIRANLARIKSEQSGDSLTAVTADSLQRVADAKRLVYNRFAEAAQQTSQEERAAEPKGSVVEYAHPPKAPASPNKGLYAMLGFLMGALLGTGIALFLEMMTKGIRTVEDVEALNVPFIASLPMIDRKRAKAEHVSLSAADYVVEHPMSRYAEALRSVRSALLLGDTVPQLIAIASSVPGEGKTNTALALGRVMAMSGDRVVLVDCDLRLGDIAKVLPEPPTTGVIEVLQDGAPLASAIKSDKIEGLDVLPLNARTMTPLDLFSGERMHQLLAELRGKYDRIILDSPPLLAVSDARTLAVQADAVLMVMRWDRTPRGAIRAALSLLEQDKAPLLGAVLSMVDPRQGSSGVEDPGNYYQMYRQYQPA